ncbi:MAG: sigma-70 family RNA polymerase sigma factor [Planctomycetes bacterium]|nr:sigma-70 family RNA polymerase sigma factor [Planctomycetota bacterium]MCB9870940.1 sigma-70 family RNA polymerase sigma factor [Planctomycetota bacterium]MCB9888304.1 sigma-70 family RNA polymerase sigma factor [Planctomycetota bacterium]
METHQDRVFGLVIRVLGCDRHTAADLCQEVFLRAFRAIGSFDGRALFSTWLHKITMNLCISEYRRRKAMKRDRATLSLDAPVPGSDDLTLDPPSREHDPLSRLHHGDIRTAVHTAMQRLPEDFRQCVVLRDMQDLSYEEIAEVLDLPAGTVRSRIHRGRLLLQRMLKEFTP